MIRGGMVMAREPDLIYDVRLQWGRPWCNYTTGGQE